MANTEKVLERILARDKHSAAETAVPEIPPAACDCAHHKDGHAAGYALGIQHATEEMQSRAPVAVPATPTHVTTVDEAMEAFIKWMGSKGEYYQWEEECLSALREALRPGDFVRGV